MDTLLTRAVREIDNEENIENHFSQTVDFYFIIHTQPVPSVCQKFLCDNIDEINLIFYYWLFQEASCDPEETLIDQLDMGYLNLKELNQSARSFLTPESNLEQQAPG